MTVSERIKRIAKSINDAGCKVNNYNDTVNNPELSAISLKLKYLVDELESVVNDLQSSDKVISFSDKEYEILCEVFWRLFGDGHVKDHHFNFEELRNLTEKIKNCRSNDM